MFDPLFALLLALLRDACSIGIQMTTADSSHTRHTHAKQLKISIPPVPEEQQRAHTKYTDPMLRTCELLLHRHVPY